MAENHGESGCAPLSFSVLLPRRTLKISQMECAAKSGQGQGLQEAAFFCNHSVFYYFLLVLE